VIGAVTGGVCRGSGARGIRGIRGRENVQGRGRVGRAGVRRRVGIGRKEWVENIVERKRSAAEQSLMLRAIEVVE
jgi:hypothetical protein